MFQEDIAAAFLKAVENHALDEQWASKKEEAYLKNKWFEKANIDQALNQWIISLNTDVVSKWLQPYAPLHTSNPKTVGIIMAGNIPLVGMHDLICILMSGHKALVKLSGDDEVLPKFWVQSASKFLPEMAERVLFSENMKEVDAAIATGSNNSARYFEYYFRNKPHILRKNRNSVAVLHGNESSEMLVSLGHDVFDYFGLGCRNVTHLLLPSGYEFKPLFDAWEQFGFMVNHNKYVNNYHYHKALLLMNLDPHMDTGFLLLKEKEDVYSPVGMLNYSFYSDVSEAEKYLQNHADEIQCVTSEIDAISNLKLGAAQKTMLWDYADNVDTMAWLKQLS